MIDETAAIAPGRARGAAHIRAFETLQPGEEPCCRFAVDAAEPSHIGQPQVAGGQTCVRRAIAQEPKELVTPARGCNPIAKSEALILIPVVPAKEAVRKLSDEQKDELQRGGACFETRLLGAPQHEVIL